MLFVVMVLRVLKGGTYSTAYASIIALIAITSIGGMLAVADADQLISSGSRR